jgi:hypothetical protein
MRRSEQGEDNIVVEWTEHHWGEPQVAHTNRSSFPKMVVVEGHLGDLRRGGDHRHGGGSITMGVDVVVV